MYLRYYGWEGDQTTITEVVKPFREDRNVNVEELAYYVRNYAGWLNVQYRVGGDLETLKKLLAAGIPVMIEESFHFDEPYWPNDDLWAAHYQLVTGYDDAKQDLHRPGQLSMGPTRKSPTRSWTNTGRPSTGFISWSTRPSRKQTIKAILGDNWDADANRQHALEAAQAETQSRPGERLCLVQPGHQPDLFRALHRSHRCL